MPTATSSSTVARTSSNDASRAAPSSQVVNARPNPPDPRTFGAKTVKPAATRLCATGEYAGRSVPSGPPWKLTTVRFGPLTPAGRYSQPDSARPSQATYSWRTGVTSTSGSGRRGADGTLIGAAPESNGTTQSPRGARGPVSSANSVAPSAASDQPGMTGSGNSICRSGAPSDRSCTHSSVTSRT